MRVTRMSIRFLIASCVACLLTTGFAETLLAQADSLTLVAGRPIRGTVESFAADNIVVKTPDGTKNVPPWNVRMIRYEGSNELVRAKSAYFDDRYSACLQEIQNMTDMPARQMLKHEIDFYRAAAATQVALRGGNVSTEKAAEYMGQFLKDYPQSYHLYPALDMFGDLAMASGRFDVAIGQFEKTSASPWPEISFYGKLKSGKAQLYAGKFAEATAAFKSTEADSNAEDYAVQSRLIAKCLRAQALAQGGNPAEGKKLAMQIIENESSRNIELFAHANNALGVCFAQEQQIKEAIRAFLKTDLLFTIDPDSHAQALYHLVDLWAKNDRPNRSSRARQKLTERYRNTYWASRVK